MVLNNVKRVEPSPLPPRIIVLPLASNGGLLHMFAEWPASVHAGRALADAQIYGRGANPWHCSDEGATGKEWLFLLGKKDYLEEHSCSGGDDLQLPSCLAIQVQRQ
jgi:hypothetical protein